MVLSLFIHCLLLLPLFCVWFLFICTVLCVLSSFAIISLGKTELTTLLLLSSWCHMAVFVLCFLCLWYFLVILTCFDSSMYCEWRTYQLAPFCIIVLHRKLILGLCESIHGCWHSRVNHELLPLIFHLRWPIIKICLMNVSMVPKY